MAKMSHRRRCLPLRRAHRRCRPMCLLSRMLMMMSAERRCHRRLPSSSTRALSLRLTCTRARWRRCRQTCGRRLRSVSRLRCARVLLGLSLMCAVTRCCCCSARHVLRLHASGHGTGGASWLCAAARQHRQRLRGCRASFVASKRVCVCARCERRGRRRAASCSCLRCRTRRRATAVAPSLLARACAGTACGCVGRRCRLTAQSRLHLLYLLHLLHLQRLQHQLHQLRLPRQLHQQLQQHLLHLQHRPHLR